MGGPQRRGVRWGPPCRGGRTGGSGCLGLLFNCPPPFLIVEVWEAGEGWRELWRPTIQRGCAACAASRGEPDAGREFTDVTTWPEPKRIA